MVFYITQGTAIVNLIQFLGAIEMGLIFGLIGMAVYLTFRVSDFPDLTVDGSYPLGAAVASVLIINGHNPLLATFIAMLAGGLAGLFTAYLHVRWKILGLLASILTMTALYSINLRIMGRPNIALLGENTLFNNAISPLILLAGIVILVFILLSYLLNTQWGLGLRASGMNSRVSQAYGINVKYMQLYSLGLSNSLVALAGALFAQLNLFADVSMGVGTIINGLAAVIIGETLIKMRGVMFALAACILGAIIYRFAIALALNAQGIGLNAADLNLIASAIVIATLVLPKLKNELLRK